MPGTGRLIRPHDPRGPLPTEGSGPLSSTHGTYLNHPNASRRLRPCLARYPGSHLPWVVRWTGRRHAGPLTSRPRESCLRGHAGSF